ncbi:MAG: hypothetical protein V7629_15350 [Motiliproteus sp.]
MICFLRFLLTPLMVLLLLSGCNHTLQPGQQTTAPKQPAQCPQPRPETGQQVACPMNYLPVCAIHADATRSTHANACSACANPEIIGYTDEACP